MYRRARSCAQHAAVDAPNLADGDVAIPEAPVRPARPPSGPTGGATTSPTRIEDDLYASAKLAGDAQSRSAAQQIAHWARIGREIQASASVSHREIADVLAGRRSYDALDAKEQAVIRAEWAERMAAYREQLDLTNRFQDEGRAWVELDDDGHVIDQKHSAKTEPGHAAAKASVSSTTQRSTTPAVRDQRSASLPASKGVR